MTWSKNWPRPRRLPWLLLISALIVAADRLTKTWVAAHIRLGGAIPIIPRVLRITHWTNEGAAFSMFAGSTSPHMVRWGLIAFTLAAALVVLIAMIRLGNRITLVTVALALILGGALGNVHDRIVLRLGRGLYRGPHLHLSLARLQPGRLLDRDRRLPALPRLAAATQEN